MCNPPRTCTTSTTSAWSFCDFIYRNHTHDDNIPTYGTGYKRKCHICRAYTQHTHDPCISTNNSEFRSKSIKCFRINNEARKKYHVWEKQKNGATDRVEEKTNFMRAYLWRYIKCEFVFTPYLPAARFALPELNKLFGVCSVACACVWTPDINWVFGNKISFTFTLTYRILNMANLMQR